MKKIVLNKLKTILVLSCMTFLVGCSSVQSKTGEVNAKKTEKVLTEKKLNLKSNKNEIKVKEKILTNFNEWKGTKYKWGGNTKNGIDCSAFIKQAYQKEFNLSLPRTTSELKYKGFGVSKNNLKVGDMVFFRNNKHVGIYIGNNEFVHSGSKKGVTKSSLDKGYYAKTFTQARRVLH